MIIDMQIVEVHINNLQLLSGGLSNSEYKESYLIDAMQKQPKSVVDLMVNFPSILGVNFD